MKSEIWIRALFISPDLLVFVKMEYTFLRVSVYYLELVRCLLNRMVSDAHKARVTKECILSTLERHKCEIASRYKVKKIGLFGSYARGEQHAGSDIDLLVEFMPGADLFDLSGLKQYLEAMFDHHVDVVPMRALRDELRAAVLADVTYI
jgi:uncharacterized protein